MSDLNRALAGCGFDTKQRGNRWLKHVSPAILAISRKIAKGRPGLDISAANIVQAILHNDRERAAEAGRKGGQASHGGSHSRASENAPETRQGQDGVADEHNPGNFAEDHVKAVAAGRKGGQSSH